jgi:hypothetical protein
MRALAAARTVGASASNESGWRAEGLPTHSTAPSSSALIAVAAPFSVMLDTITTGKGRRRMTLSRKSRPFMFGISTSSVITSGSSALIAARASIASPACPTTSMEGSRMRVAAMTPRMVAESSTTRTRTRFMPAMLPRDDRR